MPPQAICGCRNWESPRSPSPREGWGRRREIFTPEKGRVEVWRTEFFLLTGYLLEMLFYLGYILLSVGCNSDITSLGKFPCPLPNPLPSLCQLSHPCVPCHRTCHSASRSPFYERLPTPACSMEDSVSTEDTRGLVTAVSPESNNVPHPKMVLTKDRRGHKKVTEWGGREDQPPYPSPALVTTTFLCLLPSRSSQM